MKENGKQSYKDVTFKKKSLLGAYLITVGIFAFLLIWIAIGNRSLDAAYMASTMFQIPYAAVGVVLASIVKKKNKSAAIGIILGSSTPLMVLLIISGGLYVYRPGPPPCP